MEMIEYYGNEEKRNNDKRMVGSADVFYLGNYEHLGNQHRIATKDLNENTDIKVFRVNGNYKDESGFEFTNVPLCGLFSSKHGVILEPTFDLSFYQGEKNPNNDFERYEFPYVPEAGILVFNEDSQQADTYEGKKRAMLESQIQYSEVESILDDMLKESPDGKVTPLSFEEFSERVIVQRETMNRSR